MNMFGRGGLVVVSLLIACLVFILSPPLLAQSASTGALSGTVTDATGAVVPNVTVTATNTDTGQVRTGAPRRMVPTSLPCCLRAPIASSLKPPGLRRQRFLRSRWW